MTEELIKLLLILCVGQGVTFSVLLLFKEKGVVTANRLLAAFILLTIIPLWNDFIRIGPEVFNGWYIGFSWLYIPAFYGPILYLYTFYYIGGQRLTNQSWFWLALLPIAGTLLRISQSYFVDGQFSGLVWFSWYGLIYIQIATCVFLSLQLVWKFEKNLKQNLSNLDRAKTAWLKQLLVIYFIITMVSLVHLLGKLIGTGLVELLQVLVTVSEAIFIFALGFWGVNKSSTIFYDLVIIDEKKYRNSGLSRQKAEQIIADLTKLMNSEELYLDNEISLLSLSSKLNEKPHNVSQALNESLQLNFYDYINSARITRAQQMLTAPKFSNLAIIDIAYQVGFNNKTSFNNSFKKFTNKTPSQFRSEAA